MTDSVYYANPLSEGGDGTGGIDVLTGVTAAFSSVQDAIDTLAGIILATDTLTIKCAGTHDTVNVTGFTVMGRVFIEGDESYRHAGDWDDSKFTVESASNVLTIRTENTIVRWVQINDTSGGSRNAVTFQGATSGSNVDFAIIRDITGGSSDSGIVSTGSSDEHMISNSVIYGFPRAFNDSSGDGGLVSFNRCTFVDCTSINTSSKTNNPTYTNTIFSGSTNGISGSSDPLSDYNATDLSEFGTGYTTNTNDLVNQTIEFVDAANDDYRIVASSPLATAGENGEPIGAFYEESSGGDTLPLLLATSLSNNLVNNVSMSKIASLGVNSSLSDNKTGSVSLSALKALQVDGSITGNVTGEVGLGKSASLSVSASTTENYTSNILIGRSAVISLTGSSAGNYTQRISAGKLASLQLTASLSKNLTRKISFDSSNPITFGASISRNMMGNVSLGKLSPMLVGASLSSNYSSGVSLSAVKQLNLSGSLSSNLSDHVRFITGSVPDISPDDIRATSKTNRIIAKSATSVISAQNNITVYNYTITN